jgi:photosystem II stability/assembly factor-like uncharacterized protein
MHKTGFLPLCGLAIAALTVGLGAFLTVSGAPDFYSCDGMMMPASDAEAYVAKHASGKSVSEFCAVARPARAVAGEEEEEGKIPTDRPGEALSFRTLSLRDERGVVAEDGLVKAAEHAKVMAGSADGRALRAKQISRTSWTWLGPGNIGGRIRSLVIHRTNPNIMWVGSVSGGIWKTTNGGSSWAPQNDFMANLAVTALVVDPSNPNLLYAGTGEGFFNLDALRGAGIFKTANGGTTWTRLNATNNANFHFVNRLAISPTAVPQRRILAATNAGIFRSLNGGASWTKVRTGQTTDVDFHPTNSNLAIASSFGGRAYYSTNGGQTWRPATGLPVTSQPFAGRIELAYAKSDPNFVFASVDNQGGQLWYSQNGGRSYQLISTGVQFLSQQGWYDNTIWVDPSNYCRLIVGGVDLYGYYSTTNCLDSVTKLSQWQSWEDGTSAHADQHVIVQHPGFNGTSNQTVFFANDGGIYRNRLDRIGPTSGWQFLNNNLGITQFYSAAGNPTTGEIIGGTQDNGSLFYKPSTGPQNWRLTFGGDGGFSAADPSNPNVFYGEYVYLNIFRSSNRGVSGNLIVNGLGDTNRCANFIAPFILDPNQSNRMLAGGCGLWRSNNVRTGSPPAWSRIKPNIAGNVPISAIAVLKGNSNHVWVGHNNGDIYKSTNALAANPTWVKVDRANMPNRFVTRIALKTANEVFTTFGGFSPDNVWRTANGGTTWADRTGVGVTGLPSAPVRSIVIHPTRRNWLYVGTEVGVFVSEDNGVRWTAPQSGPANVSVDELFFLNNNVIVAATHGRGLFKSNTLTPPAPRPPSPPEQQAALE